MLRTQSGLFLLHSSCRSLGNKELFGFSVRKSATLRFTAATLTRTPLETGILISGRR
jgi:hypothetical protein